MISTVDRGKGTLLHESMYFVHDAVGLESVRTAIRHNLRLAMAIRVWFMHPSGFTPESCRCGGPDRDQ